MLISLGSYYAADGEAASDPLLAYFGPTDSGSVIDSADDSLIFEDSAGTIPGISGGDVGRVVDLLDGGPGLIQSNSSYRPNYIASDALFTYDGSNDFFTTGVERIGKTGLFCGAGESFFVAVVFRMPSTVNGTIVARGESSAGARTFQIYSNRGSSSADTPTFVLRGVETQTSWSLDDDQPHCVWVNWDGTTAVGGYDSGASITLNVGTAAENTGQEIIYGARTNGTGFHLTGETGCKFLIDRSMSPTERQGVVDKLLERNTLHVVNAWVGGSYA